VRQYELGTGNRPRFCLARRDMRTCSAEVTYFPINKKFLKTARRLGNHHSNVETVNAALQEYIRRKKQTRILDLFGKVDFDPTYDYKAERRRKRMG
jgi:hypothetical protein